MNIVTNQFKDLKLNYDLTRIAPLEDILFLDIETTGFSPASSVLYMIGCAYWDGITFTCKQFFAEKPEEEPEILEDAEALTESEAEALEDAGDITETETVNP